MRRTSDSPKYDTKREHVNVEATKKRGDSGRMRRSRSVPNDVRTRVVSLYQAANLHDTTVAWKTTSLHRFVVRFEPDLAQDLQ